MLLINFLKRGSFCKKKRKEKKKEGQSCLEDELRTIMRH